MNPRRVAFKALVVLTRELRRVARRTGQLAAWLVRNEPSPRIRDALPVFRTGRSRVEFARVNGFASVTGDETRA